MKGAVGKLIRFLYMHDFVNGSVYFKKTCIQAGRISDTPDDSHLLSTDNVSIQTVSFDLMFNTGNIFVRGIWL